MQKFDSLKLVKNRTSNADDSPLSFCLQLGSLCLVLFRMGYPNGRQRKMYLLFIIIFKELAVVDRLDLGEKELWVVRKWNFSGCQDAFPCCCHTQARPCTGPVLCHAGSLAM